MEEEQKEDLNNSVKKNGASLSKFFKPKSFTNLKENKCAELTQWIEVTIGELLEKVKDEEKNLHRKVGDEETCPICMCELYDDLEKNSADEIE